MATDLSNIYYIDPDNIETALPSNILRDINLLYTYSSDEFELRGVPVIENMIYNVMFTEVGSRWYEPEFGSNVLKIIHEPCTLATANKVEIEIFAAIKRWVPYISLIIHETVVIPYPDENAFAAYYNYVDIFTGLNRYLTLNLDRIIT
jgi:phage baseplate assembly protein W